MRQAVVCRRSTVGLGACLPERAARQQPTLRVLCVVRPPAGALVPVRRERALPPPTALRWPRARSPIPKRPSPAQAPAAPAAPADAPGGEYRMCWCSGRGFPCSTIEDFSVDAGSLLLLGPSPLAQGRTCVSGHACRHAALVGAQGGRLQILDTCGAAAATSPLAEPGGYASPASGAAVVLGGIAVTVGGGQFRLCWCGAAACSAQQETASVGQRVWAHLGSSPACVSRAICLVWNAPTLGCTGTTTSTR